MFRHRSGGRGERAGELVRLARRRPLARRGSGVDRVGGRAEVRLAVRRPARADEHAGARIGYHDVAVSEGCVLGERNLQRRGVGDVWAQPYRPLIAGD